MARGLISSAKEKDSDMNSSDTESSWIPPKKRKIALEINYGGAESSGVLCALTPKIWSCLLSLLRKETKGLDMVVVGPTNSSTDFCTLNRMISIKERLLAMVSSNQWIISSYLKEKETVDAAKYIKSDSFWNDCTRITCLTDHLVRLLKIVGGPSRPGMGYVFVEIYIAKEAIKHEFKEEYMYYWKIIDTRLKEHP
ncbi:hypothetical protein E3N88_19293 [Mikania micrantha]|uniref:Uncharacterized protein n=1 Tax=Mikania micrantha TaxID=192012 RepID=A0A5N6NQT3_9ASTR|nr:hypothetical protein E3N88_19293 [Mikania micrantha]